MKKIKDEKLCLSCKTPLTVKDVEFPAAWNKETEFCKKCKSLRK